MLASGTGDYYLWQSFKMGSSDAFQKIYGDHFASLFEYGVRLSQDKEFVRDAIHDLFVKLWNNKSNLGEVKNIRSYLIVSLRGSLFNKLGRENKVISSEINDDNPFEMVFSVENEMIRKESDKIKTQSVIDGLNKLSSRQKEVLYLRFYLELSYEEVSDIMGISVKATYKLNARALAALKDVLGMALFSFFISRLTT